MAGMSRVWPAPLRAGDLVAVVAPSGPVEPRRLTRGITLIESWGLRVRVAPHVFAGHRELGYLAASDEERAIDVLEAWCDPDVRAIWAARGGYGGQRMVDRLDFAAMRASGPTQLIGCSDITGLHARIGRELGVVTLHGPGLASAEQLADRTSVTALRNLLLGRPVRRQLLLTGRAMIAGSVGGMLIGGNLSLLAADVGIEPAPHKPYVLLLEEVNEPAYRVDRMITQLLRSGWLEQLAGVVVGDLGVPDAAVVGDRLGSLGLPILVAAGVGHGDRNLALPLGADVRLEVGADEASLTLA
jgi:muramoyltetrapeptide carboxypeptidase